MGPTSKKLNTRFNRWGGKFRQQMKREPIPLPKDVHDVKSLITLGHDPLHAVYVSVQNITSVFAECVSILPELKAYYKIVEAAEDEYMPDGPPMSPLTRSYFTAWAFFDVCFGGGQETIGTCLLDVSEQLDIDPGMVEAIRQFQHSRMGIYEHCGTVGGQIRLQELVTGSDFPCVCTSGYAGQPGELWYVRLGPPLVDLVDYHVTLTTPYILAGATKTDWTAYLNRAMLNLKVQDGEQPLYGLLKHGLSTNHWNEYIMLAYHHHQHDAIFLTGIPDVKGSLPHAE